MSGQVVDTQYTVHDVFYNVHTKRGADENAPKTMRVDYKVGWHQYKSEWVCFEHGGYARWKAEQWWLARSNDPIPDTAEQAVDVAQAGGLCQRHKITVRSITGEPYQRIVDYELGPKPEPVPTEEGEAGSRFVERMPSVVATCRQQNRNVLELLTGCRGARLDGCDAPSLLPAAAEFAPA